MSLLYTWYDAYQLMLIKFYLENVTVVLSIFILPVVLIFAIVLQVSLKICQVRFLLVTYSADPVLQTQSTHQSLDYIYATLINCSIG